MGMASKFDLSAFLGRWVLALLLVLGTYNPTEYCYFKWVMNSNFNFTPVMALAGIGLLIAWIVFLRSTFLAMGWLGVSLGAAFFACIVWLFVDLGWLSLDNTGVMTWVVVVILSLILATGMSWAHIRRRLSGQLSVDDVED